jgi:phosphatidylserine decarboxylase
MRIGIAKEGWPFILGAACVPLAGVACQAAGLASAAWVLYALGAFLVAGMLFFFRDPERLVTAGPDEVLSGADGVVRSVEEFDEGTYLKARCVRISVFLSIFDVHVNRCPLAGRVRTVRYDPGKHLFAFLDAASEYNEHSSILIEGGATNCLVRQIVGPVARRVVCRLQPGDEVAAGGRLGIMKFGSRMDVYLPKENVEVKVRKGQRVVAGKTVLATLRKGPKS